MYNGIGLTTPRGSGTNGHVQRNWAFVRPGRKDNSNYRSEEDIKKLDATLNRPPNKDILDHDRKRKIEVKCLEFEEILEKQGLSSDEIKAKVDSYRKKLMGQGKSDVPKDEFGRISVRDSHQLAEAQLEKNAKLREAFNISEYFIEGSSFDSDRRAKEDLVKSLALQKELDTQREQTAAAAAKEKESSSKRNILLRTPSMERDVALGSIGGLAADSGDNIVKKKRKKKARESSPSPDRKKDKKKKSKKRKRESKPKKSKKLRKRKDSESDSNADNVKESADENSESDIEAEVKKTRKKFKKNKKKRRNKKREISSSSEKSRSTSPLDKLTEFKKNETLTDKNVSTYKYRSRSKEKSYKLKEPQRRHYDSSDRNKSKVRSNIRSDKDSRCRRSQNPIEKVNRHRDDAQDYYLKRASRRSRDYRSRDRNNAVENKKYERLRSRSRQRSKREITTEHIEILKRKHSEEYSQTTRDSLSLEKRKRYSRSHSPSIRRQSRDKISYSNTTEIEISSSRVRSGTPPRQKSLNNQRKNIKSRSISDSARENLREKSLTPPPRTAQNAESNKYHINTFDNLKNSDTKSNRFDFKCKKPLGEKSRIISASSSTTPSSTNTETSKSKTPSPKKGHMDMQKQFKKRPKSLTPIITSALTERRSKSRPKSRQVLHEKNRKDKQRSRSRSEERLERSKETQEMYNNVSSKTPPPTKVEKKALSPRSSRDSSELSYSPAKRNPERYRDILENNKNQKNKMRDKQDIKKGVVKSSKQSEEPEWDRKEKEVKIDRNHAKPVVRLQAQSDEDSDVTERNNEKILDEFQESKREKELKDLKMLEELKTGIAAKAKEKIEKMAASASTSSSSNIKREVSDKPYKSTVRNSLNDFLAANNVAASCSPIEYHNILNSPPGAIYPQTLEEIEKEQESVLKLTEICNHIENNNDSSIECNETQTNCNKPLEVVTGHAPPLNPTTSPLRNNVNVINKDKDRKRERDYRVRDQERECNNFSKDRYLERRQRTSPIIYNTGGGVVGGGTVGGGSMVGARRNNNNNMLNINHRQQRLNLICNSGGVGGHHHHTHSHLYPQHHHPNHKIINNYHSTTSSSSTNYIANNSSTNPHSLMCNHVNNSTISFNRPSRINNTPLITATQFNNQMLSKQSNSILVNRRDHRTALNLGLSGTPCTNFSNSNLLLTKANTNPHHLHAAAVGHVVSGGHHHQHHHHHHHHHHGQNTSMSSSGSNPAAQITDRILMAASIAAAQRHSLSVVHSAASSVAAVAAANNLNFLQQQNKPKLVIKPFKINDSQPLVSALADSSLVDAIVSKVSTATVAAAESAARRSRSRSRRSGSRNRHGKKTSSVSSNIGGAGGERDRNFRSTSHSRSSRSSTSSRSRSRSHSHRSSRSHSFQSSSSSHTSSRTSSSSSIGSSRSGSRSPSIPRRRGSPSFLDRRRITSRYSSSRDRRH